MIRIAVCDDNQECLDKEKTIIMRYLAQCKQEYKVDAFISGKRLLESFKQNDYDLIMLDVELRDMNGMALAQQLHEINENTPIAFISAYMKYASDGYRVNALRYILKDKNISIYIEECLELLLKNLSVEKRNISIDFTTGTRQIKVSEIIFLRTNKNYTVFVIRNGDKFEELEQRNPLRKVTKQMAQYGFVSINSSESVNLHHVSDVKGNKIILDSGEKKTVSMRKYNDFLDEYMLFVRGKGL